jgi:hypothetical protein
LPKPWPEPEEVPMIRPILMGFALAASPALAAPAGMSFLPAGGGATGAHVGFHGGFLGGFRGGTGRWGWARHGRTGGEPWRHRDRRRGGGGEEASLYWGGGVALADYPEPGRGGFFEDGTAVRIRGGVAYDYDRSYPYDHYRDPRPGGEDEMTGQGGAPRCTIERVPGRGGPAEVRVCRR